MSNESIDSRRTDMDIRETTERLVREVGVESDDYGHPDIGTWSEVERLVRAAMAEGLRMGAEVCDDYANDKWALYKGRPPYTGQEDGRACQQTQGENIGAEGCAAALRAKAEEINAK